MAVGTDLEVKFRKNHPYRSTKERDFLDMKFAIGISMANYIYNTLPLIGSKVL